MIKQSSLSEVIADNAADECQQSVFLSNGL